MIAFTTLRTAARPLVAAAFLGLALAGNGLLPTAADAATVPGRTPDVAVSYGGKSAIAGGTAFKVGLANQGTTAAQNVTVTATIVRRDAVTHLVTDTITQGYTLSSLNVGANQPLTFTCLTDSATYCSTISVSAFGSNGDSNTLNNKVTGNNEAIPMQMQPV